MNKREVLPLTNAIDDLRCGENKFNKSSSVFKCCSVHEIYEKRSVKCYIPKLFI